MAISNKGLPEPVGLQGSVFVDNKDRMVNWFDIREGDKMVTYLFFEKPHTDSGITASVRRLKS